MSREDLIVAADEAGSALAEVIARRLGVERSEAERWIVEGAVFLAGKRVRKPSERVAAGARIVLHRAAEAPAAIADLPVIFEDAEVIVLDKPPGRHLNETETSPREAIVEILRARIPDVRVVHRLDRDTSGVVLLAKTAAAAASLSEAFRSRRVEKSYLALVEGSVPDGLIDDPIAIDRRRPRARRVLPEGQAAATWVHTVARAHGLSSILARPITGRTHQIRAHLAHRGAPILGDRLYGGPGAVRIGSEVWPIERLLLHARRLTVPLRSGVHTFEAAIPADLARFESHGLVLEEKSA